MGTLTQTVLPFKVEATGEMLTANAGLALFGEFVQGLGLQRWLAQEMPLPGSGRGYKAGAYVRPLVLMLAIGGCLDAPAQQAIAGIPESAWKHYPDCAVAETPHSMNDTKKAFRLVVVKYKRQGELFGDAPRYHVIASNRAETAEATLVWYRQRGEASGNGIKELKIGFGMERMPCGQFAANAAA